MIRVLLILGCFVLVLCQGKEFRFDYEFNPQAGGWLKFHVIPATWPEARLRCHAEGAVLASPLSKPLKEAIISFVEKHKGMTTTTIFTGVHTTFAKGVYSSIEGVPLSRLPITWAPGEPDNFGNSESCLAMVTDSSGSMSDVRCGDVLSYVCYKKDTHLTMTDCGTTDPGYQLKPRTGSCYKFHPRGLVWSEAHMTCVAEGGHLVIINSEIEAQIVLEMFNNGKAKSLNPPARLRETMTLLYGFRDWSMPHHNFLTTNGETFEAAGYEKWLAGEPNNQTGSGDIGDTGEYCGSILERDGKMQLNDVFCNEPLYFLCEKSPISLL